MGNRYEHWCDSEHKEPNETTNKFVIGELCKNVYKELEIYLIHDINKDLNIIFEDEKQNVLARNYVVKKFYNILDNVEKLCSTVQGANSVYGLYDIDFEHRRKGWLLARDLCFAIIAQLDHISTITMEGTNLQKYVDVSNEISIIAGKIKNVMIHDDKQRKKNCKKY